MLSDQRYRLFGVGCGKGIAARSRTRVLTIAGSRGSRLELHERHAIESKGHQRVVIDPARLVAEASRSRRDQIAALQVVWTQQVPKRAHQLDLDHILARVQLSAHVHPMRLPGDGARVLAVDADVSDGGTQILYLQFDPTIQPG